METFSALLALCAGNSPVPVNSPHKGQWHGALMFSLICAWISGWVNNREAGDLRRQRAHYGVIVMVLASGTRSLIKQPQSHWSCMTLYSCVFLYTCIFLGIFVINTLMPRQNGRHFADVIFKCIFLNENAWIHIKISLKFVPKGSINNIPALVQIMVWRRPGDKPLSEPMLVRIPTHIHASRPPWVKRLIFSKR